MVERKEVAQRLFAVWGTQSSGQSRLSLKSQSHVGEIGVRNVQFLAEKRVALGRIALQSYLQPGPPIILQNHTAKSRCATQTVAYAWPSIQCDDGSCEDKAAATRMGPSFAALPIIR